MAKAKEPKSIRVGRIDCEDDGVKSRAEIYVTPTYAREQLGLSAEWVAAHEGDGI